MSAITIQKAATLLDVSEATVRNWVKCGYLHPTSSSETRIELDTISSLKAKIETGEIDKLRKRANKRHTETSFIPDEYIQDPSFVEQLENIRHVFHSNNLDIEASLFVLALRQLKLMGEVYLASENILDLTASLKWKRQCVKEEMYSWRDDLSLQNSTFHNEYLELYDTLLDVSHDDTLGIIYQSLLLEGSKSKTGAYYTPVSIIDEIFLDQANTRGRFLDPCCGTGQFLIRAARAGYSNPTELYGFDIDKLAVRIARLNLFMVFHDIQFEPQIRHANTLSEVACDSLFCNTNTLRGSFALVATNPPWGAKVSGSEMAVYKKFYPNLQSGETFSMFLMKSLELVQDGGQVSFILPDSILNIKCHSDIREHILSTAKIKGIKHLGRAFKGVFTEVVRMDLVKTSASDDSLVSITKIDGESHSVPQLRFVKNSNSVIDSRLSEVEHDIILALQSIPHVTLNGNAEWALGIVTGNNKKHLSDVCNEGMEPIYRGSDIEPFHLRQARSFIHFDKSVYQQVAPESKYRNEQKLIYRFISKRLVFALDTLGSLTLNSANICIPNIRDYPIKLIMGLLNSNIYQFVFAKLFHTHKVLRGDLERLPLPLLPENYQTEIINLVDEAIDGKDIINDLNTLIVESVGLTQVQRRTILDWN